MKIRISLISKNSCIVFLLFLYSSAFSQTALEKRNISLRLNDASLIEVIKAIEARSGVSFVYNTTVMKNAQKICLNVEDVDLKILLQRICSESGNNYKVINNQVIFFKVAAPSEVAIKILMEPKTKKKQLISAQHVSNSTNIILPANNAPDLKSCTDTRIIDSLDSNKSKIADTLSAESSRIMVKWDSVQIVPIPPPNTPPEMYCR